MDVADTTPENPQSDQREPAWRPARAIGGAEMPRNIFRYVLKTSGWHQLFLLLLTVGVFLLEVVPLELQRRIVNDLAPRLLARHRPMRRICRRRPRAGGRQARPQCLSQLGRRARNLRSPTATILPNQNGISGSCRSSGLKRLIQPLPEPHRLRLHLWRIQQLSASQRTRFHPPNVQAQSFLRRPAVCS